MVRACLALVLWLAVPIAALALFRFIPGVEKTVNHLGKISLERVHGIEGNIDKTMLAASFHELGNAAKSVDVHDDEEAVSSGNPDDLTQERDLSGLPI